MLRTTLWGTHDHVTILYGYTVRAPKRFLKELKRKTMKQHNIPLTNWERWRLCEEVYTESGVYQVSMVDHQNKIIQFSHHFMEV